MVFDCVQRAPTQNRLRFVAFTLSLLSLILSIFSIQKCTFVLSGTTESQPDTMYGWGLFTTPVYDKEGHIQGCIPYPSSVELGPALKTAQAFGIMLSIFIATIFLGFVLVQFFLERGTTMIYHIIRVCLPSAFCCQLLTFAAFASPFCSEIKDELDGEIVPAACLPGSAGVVAIFNLVAIIVMTIVMSMVSPPDHPLFQIYGTGNSLRVRDSHSRSHGHGHGNSNSNSRGSGKTRGHKSSSSNSRRKKKRGMEQVSLQEPQRPGKDRVKTTIVNGPQVRKTIKEITHSDGSQTITTTVEEIRDEDSFDDDDDESTVLEIL